MGCIDGRKGIFIDGRKGIFIDGRKGIFITTLWERMQSCIDQIHSIKIYPQDYRRLEGCDTFTLPASYAPEFNTLS